MTESGGPGSEKGTAKAAAQWCGANENGAEPARISLKRGHRQQRQERAKTWDGANKTGTNPFEARQKARQKRQRREKRSEAGEGEVDQKSVTA